MTDLGSPFLKQIRGLEERFDRTRFPFNIPAYSDGIDINLDTSVTFLVGENGSGKSTLLEAIAEICGFDPEGGNRDHYRAAFEDRSDLAQAIVCLGCRKPQKVFFSVPKAFLISLHTLKPFLICGHMAVSLCTNSHTVNHFWLCLRTGLNRDYTF